MRFRHLLGIAATIWLSSTAIANYKNADNVQIYNVLEEMANGQYKKRVERVNCFSFEEFGPVHKVNIFDFDFTEQGQKQVLVMQYLNSTEQKAYYRFVYEIEDKGKKVSEFPLKAGQKFHFAIEQTLIRVNNLPTIGGSIRGNFGHAYQGGKAILSFQGKRAELNCVMAKGKPASQIKSEEVRKSSTECYKFVGGRKIVNVGWQNKRQYSVDKFCVDKSWRKSGWASGEISFFAKDVKLASYKTDTERYKKTNVRWTLADGEPEPTQFNAEINIKKSPAILSKFAGHAVGID